MSDFESDWDDSDDRGLLKKALDVTLPEDFDPNKIPQTGEEYLQHVMYERTKCKTWITSDIDCSQFRSNQTFKVQIDTPTTNVPKQFLPSDMWQAQKVDDFITFRKFVHSKLTVVSRWLSTTDEAHLIAKVNEGPPKFSEVACYSQAGKIYILQVISKYLDSLDKGMSFNTNLGSWLYAIMALLEKPLSPSSCHTLREFAKRCISIRSNLVAEAGEELYVPLNLFICIVARFFNQLDLADT